ncbi:HNH endonuclease [Cannes 8 virus]|nr:HNH endonuclease [Cannes 8 virus]
MKKRERRPNFFVLSKMCDCGEEEIWKVIDGYEYQVSSCGRFMDEGRHKFSAKYERISIGGKFFRVSRTIAEAFQPNPNNLPIVRRKIPADNHAKNFFWSLKGAPANKKLPRENKIPIEQWSPSGDLIKLWDSQREAAEGVPGAKADLIRACYMGKTKTHKGFVWKRGNDDIEGEQWKVCSIFPYLKISDHGRILLKNGAKSFGVRGACGYMLYRTKPIHRMVAEAFCAGKTEEKCVVNHRDLDKTNNKKENLEWCTHSWNSRHSYIPKGNVPMKGEDQKTAWVECIGVPGFFISENGDVKCQEGFLLEPRHHDGAPFVCIKGKKIALKKLVADAFIPNPENKKFVRCLDGNSLNVNKGNLVWCAPKDIPKKKMVKIGHDKIVQLSLDGIEIGEWNSSMEAATETGLIKNHIDLCIRGKKESCGGFYWKFRRTLDLPGEIWRETEYKGKKYTVSSMGRVLTSRGRKSAGTLSGRYMIFDNEKIHRIVATAFLPPPLPSQSQVNHIDGQKDHNAASNLEWVTPSRNIRHAHESGLISLPDRS